MAELIQWTIYDHPLDHPEHFVAREWRIGPGVAEPTDVIVLCDTLEEARDAVPPGLVCLQRHPMDDPVIIETWL